LINTHNGIKELELPRVQLEVSYKEVYDHLTVYKEILERRNDKGDQWYNLRNCAHLNDFDKPKLVYPNMTKFLPFYYDTDGHYLNDKCFMITGNHIEYLIAFLNSSIFKYCFRDVFPELQGGTRELRKVFFDLIPVKQITDEVNLIFKDKIKVLQSLKVKGESTIQQEKEIDKMLFNIYNLTAEEQSVIGFIEIV